MPRNYANGLIYKLARRDGHGECYVGSTCDLRTRRQAHKNNCMRHDTPKGQYALYVHIRANGGWDEWNCVPIEEFPCETRTQLLIRERHWVDTLKPSLNSHMPASIALGGGQVAYNRTNAAAWAMANPERVRERSRAYRAEHREAVLQKKREYREQNREALRGKARLHREANREMLRERQRAYMAKKGAESMVKF